MNYIADEVPANLEGTAKLGWLSSRVLSVHFQRNQSEVLKPLYLLPP